MAIDPLRVQFDLLHDCIRGCTYGDFIMRKPEKKDAWWSICDMCYADAVLSWNSIFGVDSQESHWKKFTEANPVPSGSRLKPFSSELIAQGLGISDQQWAEYWRQMGRMRNKRLAHFDHNAGLQQYPNITYALHSACFYRNWLRELIAEMHKTGESISFDGPTNDEMLSQFRTQIEAVC